MAASAPSAVYKNDFNAYYRLNSFPYLLLSRYPSFAEIHNNVF